jgi:uncharacterized membrane protein HdeD (DUF308 family)
MIIALSRNWWALLLQGISAALFGLGALLVPGFTLLLLALLMALSLRLRRHHLAG